MSTAQSNKNRRAPRDRYMYQLIRRPSRLWARVNHGIQQILKLISTRIGTFLEPIWEPIAVFARTYLGSLYRTFFPWRSDALLLLLAAAWYVIAGVLAAYLPILGRAPSIRFAAVKFGAAGGFCAGFSSLIVLRLLEAALNILQGRSGAKGERWATVLSSWLAVLTLAFGIPPLVCYVVTTYTIGRAPAALMIASAVTGAPLLPPVHLLFSAWPTADTAVNQRSSQLHASTDRLEVFLYMSPSSFHRRWGLGIFEPDKLFSKSFKKILYLNILFGIVASGWLSLAGFVFVRISRLKGFELCPYDAGAIAGLVFGCIKFLFGVPSLLIFRRRRWLRAYGQSQERGHELSELEQHQAHQAHEDSMDPEGSFYDRMQQDLPDMIRPNPLDTQPYPSHLLSKDVPEPNPLITPWQSYDFEETWFEADGIHDSVLAAALPLFYGPLASVSTVPDQTVVFRHSSSTDDTPLCAKGPVRYSIRSPRRPTQDFIHFVKKESADFVPPQRFGASLLAATDRSRLPPPLSRYLGLLSTGTISGLTTPQSTSSRAPSPTRMPIMLPKNYTIGEVYRSWQQDRVQLPPALLIESDRRDPTGIGRVPWRFLPPLKPFEKGRDLGHGRYCDQVRLVRSKKTGHVFAVKSVKKHRSKKLEEHEDKEPLPREKWFPSLKLLKREQDNLAILKKANDKHLHLILLQGSYRTFNKFGLLLSPVADWNLQEYFHQCDSPHTVEAVRIELRLMMRPWFGCLASAVTFVHEHGIVHWDIRPQNILYQRDGDAHKILLSDFNASQHLGRPTKGSHCERIDLEVFSKMYAAPELDTGELKGELRCKLYDVFSLGCVYLEILSVIFGRSAEEFDKWRKKHAVVQDMRFSQHTKRDTLRLEWWQNEDIFDLRRIKNPSFEGLAETEDLVFQMLSVDPWSRPVASKIKFTGVWSGPCCTTEQSVQLS